MRVDDVVRLDLGTFVRPAEETGTAVPRVEARTSAGGLLLDTGPGEADAGTDPGHVDGHQSVVLECDDGSIVLAGQLRIASIFAASRQ